MTAAISQEPHEEKSLPAWVSGGRIPNLDGLRAVAILLVLCEHWLNSAGSRLPAALQKLPRTGGFGVNIFFAVSGFLITLLMLREFTRTGRISLRGFYTRRALRIFPAYLAFLLFVALLDFAGIVRIGATPWLACLTYTVNYLRPYETPWVIGHIWSLSVEEHFYLLWPLTVVWLGPKRALRALVLVVAASPVLRVALWRAFHDEVNQGFITPTRLDSIGMGCLLAYLVRAPRLWRILARLRRPELKVLAMAVAFSVVFLGIFLPRQARFRPRAKPRVGGGRGPCPLGGLFGARSSQPRLGQ